MAEGRRVIFLDVDGVLNRYGTIEQFGGYLGLDRELVARFNALRLQVGADVVLSSTWRLLPDFAKAVIDVIPIVDATPETGESRGADIQAWLDVNEVGRYAIIDDDLDMLAGQMTNAFFTSAAEGLTAKIAEAVAAHFRRQS